MKENKPQKLVVLAALFGMLFQMIGAFLSLAGVGGSAHRSAWYFDLAMALSAGVLILAYFLRARSPHLLLGVPSAMLTLESAYLATASYQAPIAPGLAVDLALSAYWAALFVFLWALIFAGRGKETPARPKASKLDVACEVSSGIGSLALFASAAYTAVRGGVGFAFYILLAFGADSLVLLYAHFRSGRMGEALLSLSTAGLSAGALFAAPYLAFGGKNFFDPSNLPFNYLFAYWAAVAALALTAWILGLGAEKRSRENPTSEPA